MEILRPSVNRSEVGFSIENGDIRFGLQAIKNVGAGAKQVIAERKNGPFKGLLDFCLRMNLSRFNRKKLESLIRAGGFDGFGDTRSAMLHHVDQIWDHLDEVKKHEKKKETYAKRILVYQQRQANIEYWMALPLAQKKEHKTAYEEWMTACGIAVQAEETLPPVPEVDGRPALQKKPGKMIEPVEPQLPTELVLGPHPEFPTLEVLGGERELLGCYISGHPLDYVKLGRDITMIEEVKTVSEDGQIFRIVAVPAMIKERTTKAKKRWASLTLEDKSGTIEAVMRPNIYDKYFHLIDNTKPIELRIKTEVIEEGPAKLSNGQIIDITEIKTEAIAKPRTTTTRVPVENLDGIKPGEMKTRLHIVGEHVTWDLGKVKIEGENE